MTARLLCNLSSLRGGLAHRSKTLKTMKLLSLWPHASVHTLHVCVAYVHSRALACSGVWSRGIWLSRPLKPPETVQLLHTRAHLGRVWLWLRREHMHMQTPADTQ